MTEVVPLVDAREESRFGAKATGLGAAMRAGLPSPPGLALSGSFVDEVAAGQERAIEQLTTAARSLAGPLAVRSSAADEDGADASFAGQHLTLLNVPSVDDLTAAVREIWWSANSDSAITYRQRVGLFARPSVGVVVQSLLDPDVAGVMFTQNPINGADERLIEASWGLGEVVVAGRVIPDTFRIDHAGAVLERTPGFKKIAIRAAADGGTFEETVAPELVEQLCLDDDQLAQLNALAGKCEEVYGPARDIEWAFAGGQLYLLQCRAVTRGVVTAADRAAGCERAGRGDRARAALRQHEPARRRRHRRAVQGTPLRRRRDDHQGGRGRRGVLRDRVGRGDGLDRRPARATLTSGDYFGEIALIDEGARSATITANGELVCYGLTYWEFRPLVQHNATIAWNLLQTLAKRLRTAQDDQPA